ncbi:Syntaxin-32 [Acorus calamus]|uniref:Syntaxin-32 n=1 Tax=Acorus calamus TaxID=4465 RepID=A0AAV9EDI0_ACOCL|nr:Syntaxin-32 [Acorus calamus]
MPIKTAQSSYRDRTQELLAVAEGLRKSLSSESSGSTAAAAAEAAIADPDAPGISGSRSAVSVQSEFNRKASKIGLGIHQTSQKLAKLAKLAKKPSVFNDPTMEIQELTAVIKQDITALNSAVVDLQLLCNKQNESGSISKDTTNHSTTVVDNLKNRLMSATKEFKEVLTMRTENMKVHENRRQLFSKTPSKDATNPFIRQRPLVSRASADTSSAPLLHGHMTLHHLLSCFQGASSLSRRKQMNGETSASAQPLLHQQQQQQQQQLVPVQDTYMQSRAEALQNVESTIHELSNIFTQLATMVSQQGELAIS